MKLLIKNANWAVAKNEGEYDIVLSLHKTEDQAYAAIKKMGFDVDNPWSLAANNIVLFHVGPKSCYKVSKRGEKLLVIYKPDYK